MGGVSFGYCFEAPISWRDMLELARKLDEESNFESLWIADSLLPNGELDEPKLEAWTALAAIAQATSRLRLGLLVAGNPYRHPALTAKIVTTLDHISDGRVELGIGAGWPDADRRFGVEFWDRRERLDRFLEAVQVIKLLWTERRPRFEGRYYTLNEPPYSPGNVQQPHPPILIGGASETMLRAMAEYADAAHPMVDVVDLQTAMSTVHAYCDELGRDKKAIRWVSGGPLFLHDDPRVQQRAIQFAANAYGQSEEELRRIGLFGSAHEVCERLRQQVDQGVSEFIVFQLPHVHTKSLLRFSGEVITAFK